ncbi:MAG TPA: hypothetical protein IAA35_02710 [Candidatus Alistipes faecigallinarum]|uniref:hypothetical protein n=1 Tax=uncultured Alistipes sp. TaxID=538949 RepID=UPI001F9F6668|nr:hypothetical protein [uncultured Alistipes sp.]HIY46935.1 hypothetical protein [Candidatus Alistipes faecigallinarum]
MFISVDTVFRVNIERTVYAALRRPQPRTGTLHAERLPNKYSEKFPEIMNLRAVLPGICKPDRVRGLLSDGQKVAFGAENDGQKSGFRPATALSSTRTRYLWGGVRQDGRRNRIFTR